MSALRGHLRECGLGAQCPVCPKVVTQRRNLVSNIKMRLAFFPFSSPSPARSPIYDVLIFRQNIWRNIDEMDS